MTEPAANLLRFGQLRQWCGLNERALLDLVADGKMGGAALWPGGKRFFLRTVARHVLFGAPLPSCLFGAEPEPELLRVYDVLTWTGLREDQFRWAERHLPPGLTLLTAAGGKRLYRKHAIRAHLFVPLLPVSLTCHAHA